MVVAKVRNFPHFGESYCIYLQKSREVFLSKQHRISSQKVSDLINIPVEAPQFNIILHKSRHIYYNTPKKRTKEKHFFCQANIFYVEIAQSLIRAFSNSFLYVKFSLLALLLITANILR
jgi:hypothetical protein